MHVHAVTAVGSGGTTSESAAYDAAGAMTCRALKSASCTNPTPSGQTLSYDALRRLVSWQNGSTSSEQYAEDGEGTRVWRQTTGGAWTTTTVAILGMEEVTTSSLGGAPTATRFYALPGGVRATRDRTGLVYEASDQLGTPIAALTLTSGIVGEQLRAPYGQARYAAAASGGSGGLRTPYGFTGQREDTTPAGSSGLDDFHARMYDPVVGRFTSADDAQPGLGDPSGQDGYAYVGGRVENATDPSGQMGFDFENRGLGLGFAEKGEVGGAAGIGLIIVNLVDLTVYTAQTLFGTAPTTSTPALRPLAPPKTGPVPLPEPPINRKTKIPPPPLPPGGGGGGSGTGTGTGSETPTQTGGSGSGQPPHVVVSSGCGCGDDGRWLYRGTHRIFDMLNVAIVIAGQKAQGAFYHPELGYGIYFSDDPLRAAKYTANKLTGRVYRAWAPQDMLDRLPQGKISTNDSMQYLISDQTDADILNATLDWRPAWMVELHQSGWSDAPPC